MNENWKYEAFVDKFRPRLTTDDCYTPDDVYNAVVDWCRKEYKLQNKTIKRPFFPGGDYQAEKYESDEIVIDNPPFSIITEIVRFYADRKIQFFLFAPALTLFSSGDLRVSYLTIGAPIIYENGANVSTSFITNLDEYFIRTAPDLRKIIIDIQKKNTPSLPIYEYPDDIFTATKGQYFSKHNIDFRINKGDALIIRQLESQKAVKKTIFGSGCLLSEKAAAEKAAAEKAAAEKAGKIIWNLSTRERALQQNIKEEYKKSISQDTQKSIFDCLKNNSRFNSRISD